MKVLPYKVTRLHHPEPPLTLEKTSGHFNVLQCVSSKGTQLTICVFAMKGGCATILQVPEVLI